MFFDDLPTVAEVNQSFTLGPRYEPINYELQQVVWASPEELIAELHESAMHGVRSRLIFDVECYPNFFLVLFRSINSGKVLCLWADENVALDIPTLVDVFSKFQLIGFNSNTYDRIMCTLAAEGHDCDVFANMSNELIEENLTAWSAEKHFGIKLMGRDMIDIMPVLPQQASLKLYAGRAMCKRMQDLPIPPGTYLSQEEKHLITHYCVNDLDNTQLLYDQLDKQLELRNQMSQTYQADLRSKSDAQIAETVITKEIQRKTGTPCTKSQSMADLSFKYDPPAYMQFQTEAMQRVFDVVRNATYTIGESGHVNLPDSFPNRTKASKSPCIHVKIGQTTYTIGNGGLHSTEANVSHFAQNGYQLIDCDVASYYPAIIINQGLFPTHLGSVFLDVYTKIRDDRIVAKRAGNKPVANSLKIVINGSFGKFGSKWSYLYAPQLMIQVTLGGQLSLLMLIEQLERVGIKVVSGNTDGIVIKPKDDQVELMRQCVEWWCQVTGFEMEETHYDAVHSISVNDYIAIKKGENPTYKTNSSFKYFDYSNLGGETRHLEKNPYLPIVQEAVARHLGTGEDLRQIIEQCKDVRKFVCVRTVQGGALKDGHELGKAIRWYYKRGVTSGIHYKKSGNKVPSSEGAWPLMEMTDELPDDIDYDYYVDAAWKKIRDVGIVPNFLGKSEA